jgi:cyclophilin family peptidyl-prolyl cis-trans isomerase
MSKRRMFGPLLVAAALAGAIPSAEAQPNDRPRVGDERILFRTSRGDLVLGLYPDVAPRTVAQVLNLVRLGVYDSAWFYRIEPNFVAQVTDARNRKSPLTPEQEKALTKVPAEFSSVPHRSGVLSMARQNDDVNSGESSFSILLGPAPHLDGKYTVFGQVEWGMPLVAAVASEPRDPKNSPLTPLIIESAVIKTSAEIAEMISGNQLRQVVRLAGAAGPAPMRVERLAQPASGLSNIAVVAVILMILCNLAGFVLGNKWPAQTRGAFNLLPVLIGFFLLLTQVGSKAVRMPLLGVALFAGVVGLFKLMNRFESTPPSDRPAAK